jgi:peptidyl-prolyl cis-trans isomerase SurA
MISLNTLSISHRLAAAIATIALSAVVTSAAFAQTREVSTRGQLVDRVVAIVNDGVVLQSELDAEVTRITQRLRQNKTELPPANVLRKQILDRLIIQTVQLQRAKKMGVQISDDNLNEAMAEIAQRNNVSFGQLPELLQSQGIDYSDYREEVRREIALQSLRQHDVIQRINVSPRELEQFMARQQNQPDQNAEYNLSHILVSVQQSATADQVAAREARMREVIEKLDKGEDFAQLAVAYSDSSTNIDGGSLGWRKGVELPSIVSDKIPQIKPGTHTEVIRTPSGFHVFRLNEMRGGVGETVIAQAHARHILLRTNDLEDDRTVEQRLSKIRERIVGGEDFAAIAAVTSADPGSAVQGGDLGWASAGTYVPEMEQQLDQLKENEISQPFRSQFGWHIVQLLGRRLHDATEDMKRNRAYAALREAKAEEEIELWTRRLRNDAYVDYKL